MANTLGICQRSFRRLTVHRGKFARITDFHAEGCEPICKGKLFRKPLVVAAHQRSQEGKFVRLWELDLIAHEIRFHKPLDSQLAVETDHIAVFTWRSKQDLGGLEIALCLGKPALHKIPDNLLTTSHR